MAQTKAFFITLNHKYRYIDILARDTIASADLQFAFYSAGF